jgi:hypothetical protein
VAGVDVDKTAIGRIFRDNSGRSVAALIRVFGDIDVAEDAVQEAFAVALIKWPRDGLPPNPAAGSPPPPASARSTVCVVSLANASSSAEWWRARPRTTIQRSPRRPDLCRMTGFD